MVYRILILVLVFIAAVDELRAEQPGNVDWPHVRGPTYDGHSSEKRLADAWPVEGPPLLWERELGQGYSGLVAGGGRLFTQFQTRTTQFVVALDPDSGTELWRRRVGWSWQPAGAYPGPYATPTYHAGRVYFATPAGIVGCIDATGGSEFWSVDVQEKFEGHGTEFGFASTPLIEAGKVIVPVGGKEASVVALDATNGAIVWAVGDDPASYCPAMPVTLGGRRLVLAFLRNSLVAHDLETGERVWRKALSREYDEHSAWPLYREPDVLISAPFRRGSHSFRLDRNEKGFTSQELWSGKELSLDVCSAVRVGDAVFGFDIRQHQASTHRASRGSFKCLDFTSGKLRWETEDVGQCTILAADGKLILLDEKGQLILAKTDASKYAELARVKVFSSRAMGWTPPALSGGRLFIRNHERVACLFLGLPSELEPQRPRANLAVRGHHFDWSRVLVREPDFPNDAPSIRELATWYAWCGLGVFGGAAVVASMGTFIVKRIRLLHPPVWWGRHFVLFSLLFGLAGTTILGAWTDTFVLTWPAALYTAFRVTTEVGTRARQGTRRARLLARVVLLLFVLACYGYFQLCIAVGYTMAWSFLGGLIVAAPGVIVAS